MTNPKTFIVALPAHYTIYIEVAADDGPSALATARRGDGSVINHEFNCLSALGGDVFDGDMNPVETGE